VADPEKQATAGGAEERSAEGAENETSQASRGWGMGRLRESVLSSLNRVRGGALAENDFGTF